MIAVYNLEPKYINIAIEKIKMYYKSKGEQVEDYFALNHNNYETIYASSIFDFTDKQYITADMITGGTGFDDFGKKLPEEIDAMKPKLNIGFTTRGCIRDCYFCKVPVKEGKIRIEGDIYDLWDGKSKEIILIDNNILALPKHFFHICEQLRKENLKVDFNQGLDCRLLTNEIAKQLLSLKHAHEIRFAFDDIKYESSVIRALKILKEHGLRDWGSRWYIYIGEKDNYESVYHRMNLIREHKQAVYVMRDNKVYNNPVFIMLASWGNTIGAFKLGDLKEVMEKSKRMNSYRKIFTECNHL